jgi:hypothetical protein
MRNPCSLASHNIVPPRYITNLAYGFSGTLTTANSYEFGIVGNSPRYPSYSIYTSPTANFIGAGTGAIYPNATALPSLNATGFGLLDNLYQSYRVRASSIRVICIPTNAGPIKVTVVPVNTYLSSTDGQAAQSQPYSKSRLCTGYEGTKDATIHAKMDTASLFGITEAQFQGDEAFSALTSTVPTKLWNWITYVDSVSNATTAVACEVEVIYEVEFWNPLNSKYNV